MFTVLSTVISYVGYIAVKIAGPTAIRRGDCAQATSLPSGIQAEVV